MSQNLLGLSPFQPLPIQQISQTIASTLQKYPNTHIQIQFKYAELIAFCESYYDRQQLPNQIKAKVLGICHEYVIEQNRLHLQTLKKLSNYNLIILNPLGRRVYALCGGFDERYHKRFYKIREFLINLCNQNSKSMGNHHNFYSQIQNIFLNKTFKLVDASQLRFDVNVKQGEGAGRYSYAVGKGWTKTNKQNLIREQFDLMMVEKTFRLAIKRQQQQPVTFQQVSEVLNTPAAQKGGVFLRFKRALRVTKNNQVQIALSEIYQPQQVRRAQCLQDLKDMLLLEPHNMDLFCQNVFQEFYMWEPKKNEPQNFVDLVSKYEIESQFLEQGIKKIKELNKKRNYRELDRYIETTFHDLYALCFVDHSVKKRQVNVINQLIKDNGVKLQFPQCRLQNQFGTYMHDIVHEYMTSQQ